MSADGIFISYRRGDSQHAAGRLADALVREFGDKRIFRDIEDIEAGADFVETLERALAECSVMLVVMGAQWLDARNAQGQRRLDTPGDWVREEIVRALQRGIRVVPVLLERTEVPAGDTLPDDLKALTRRQAIHLADSQWSRDVAALIAAVRPHLGIAATVGPALAAAAPAIGTRLEAGMRTGLTWAVRLLLGAGALLLVIVFFTVRACNSDTPDLTGHWSSADGWALDFVPQQRSGETVYRATGTAAGAARLECDGTPGMFGSLDLECQLGPGTATADRLTCSGLYLSGAPLTATGSCNWQRDGSTRKLALKR